MNFNPLTSWHFTVCIDAPFAQTNIFLNILDILDNPDSNIAYLNIALKQLVLLDDFFLIYALPQVHHFVERTNHNTGQITFLDEYYKLVLENVPLKNQQDFKQLHKDFIAQNSQSTYQTIQKCIRKIEEKEFLNSKISYRDSLTFFEHIYVLSYVYQIIQEPYGGNLKGNLLNEFQEQDDQINYIISSFLGKAIRQEFGRLGFILAAHIYRILQPEDFNEELLILLNDKKLFPNLLLEPDLLQLLIQAKYFAHQFQLEEGESVPAFDFSTKELHDEFYNFSFLSQYQQGRDLSKRIGLIKKMDYLIGEDFNEGETSHVLELTFWQFLLFFEAATQQSTRTFNGFCDLLILPDLNNEYHPYINKKTSNSEYEYNLFYKLKLEQGRQNNQQNRGRSHQSKLKLLQEKRDEKLTYEESRKVLFSPIPSLKIVGKHQKNRGYFLTFSSTVGEWYENVLNPVLFFRVALFSLIGYKYLQLVDGKSDRKSKITELLAYQHSFGFAHKRELIANGEEGLNEIVKRDVNKALSKKFDENLKSKIEQKFIDEKINALTEEQKNTSKNWQKSLRKQYKSEISKLQNNAKNRYVQEQLDKLTFEQKRKYGNLIIPQSQLSLQQYAFVKLKTITKLSTMLPSDIGQLFEDKRNDVEEVRPDDSQETLFYKVVFPQVVYDWISDTYPGISSVKDIKNEYLDFLKPLFKHLWSLRQPQVNKPFLKSFNLIQKAVPLFTLFPEINKNELFERVFFENFIKDQKGNFINPDFNVSHKVAMIPKESNEALWLNSDIWNLIGKQENKSLFYLVRAIEMLKILGDVQSQAETAVEKRMELTKRFKEEFKSILFGISANYQLGRFVRLKLVQVLSEPIFLDWEEGQELVIHSLIEFGSVYDINYLVNKVYQLSEETHQLEENQAKNSFHTLLLNALFVIANLGEEESSQLANPHHKYYEDKKKILAEMVLLKLAYSVWLKRKDNVFENYIYNDFIAVFEQKKAKKLNEFFVEEIPNIGTQVSQNKLTLDTKLLNKVPVYEMKSLTYNPNSNKSTIYKRSLDLYENNIENLFNKASLEKVLSKSGKANVLGFILHIKILDSSNEYLYTLDVGLTQPLEFWTKNGDIEPIGKPVSVEIRGQKEDNIKVAGIEKIPLVFGNSTTLTKNYEVKRFFCKNWLDLAEVSSIIETVGDGWFVDYVNLYNKISTKVDYEVLAINNGQAWIPLNQYLLELLVTEELHNGQFRLVLLETNYLDPFTNEYGYLFSSKPGIHYFIKDEEIAINSEELIKYFLEEKEDFRGAVFSFTSIVEDNKVLLSLNLEENAEAIDFINCSIREAFDKFNYLEAKSVDGIWRVETPKEIATVFPEGIVANISDIIGEYRNLKFKKTDWNPLKGELEGRFENRDSFKLTNAADFKAYLEDYRNLQRGHIIDLATLRNPSFEANEVTVFSPNHIACKIPISTLTFRPVSKQKLNNEVINHRQAVLKNVAERQFSFALEKDLDQEIIVLLQQQGVLSGVVVEKSKSKGTFTFWLPDVAVSKFQVSLKSHPDLVKINPSDIFELQYIGEAEQPMLTITQKEFKGHALWDLQVIDIEYFQELRTTSIEYVGYTARSEDVVSLYYESKKSSFSNFTGQLFRCDWTHFEMENHNISYPPTNLNQWKLWSRKEALIALRNRLKRINVGLSNKKDFLFGSLDITNYNLKENHLKSSMIRVSSQLSNGLYDCGRFFELEAESKRTSKKSTIQQGKRQKERREKNMMQQDHSDAALQKFKKFIDYIDAPDDVKDNLRVTYQGAYDGVVDLVDFEIPTRFQPNRNYGLNDIKRLEWTKKVKLMNLERQYSPHQSYKYLTGKDESGANGLVRLFCNDRGAVTASSKRVHPFSLEGFMGFCEHQRLDYKKVVLTFIGIFHETQHRGSFQLEIKEETPIVLFEFGFGKLIAIPAKNVFYRRDNVLNLNNIMFLGDIIEGVEVRKVRSEAQLVFSRIKFYKTTYLYNDAKRSNVVHVLYVDSQRFNIKRIMGKKRIGSEVHFMHKFVDAKINPESIDWLRERYQDTQFGEIVLYGTLDTYLFEQTRGRKVIFNLIDLTTNDKKLEGKLLFFRAGNIVKQKNRYNLRIKPLDAESDISLASDDFLEQCFVRRRDFSANSYTLIKYFEESNDPEKQEKGVDILYGKILLIKVLFNASSGKYVFSLIGSRKGINKGQFKMPIREHSILREQINLMPNRSLFGVIVSKIRGRDFYVIEIKPGIFVRLPIHMLDNSSSKFYNGDIVKINKATMDKSKYVVLLAKSSDNRFFNQPRMMSIFPKGNITAIGEPFVNKKLNPAWFSSKFFTLNEFPNIELDVQKRTKPEYFLFFLRKKEKFAFIINGNEISIIDRNPFYMNILPCKIRVQRKDNAIFLIRMSIQKNETQEIKLDWFHCSFQESSIKEISQVMEKEEWQYLDNSPLQLKMSTNTSSDFSWQTSKLYTGNVYRGPLFAKREEGQYTLRYATNDLWQFGFSTEILINSLQNQKKRKERWYTVAHASKTANDSHRLWLEICPGRIAEVLSELIVVRNTNKTLSDFYWEAFSTGDQIRLRLIKGDPESYEEDRLELLEWRSSPRNAFGKHAFLPVHNGKGCLNLGKGHYQLKLPTNIKWEDSMLCLTSNNNFFRIEKDSIPQKGDVVFLTVKEEEVVAQGFEQYQIQASENGNYWKHDPLQAWLQASVSKDLLAIMYNALPVTVEKVDEAAQILYFSRKQQMVHSTKSEGKFVNASVLGFLNDKTVLLKCGQELLPFPTERIAESIPEAIIEDAFKLLILKKWNIFYIRKENKAWMHGFNKSESNQIRCSLINFIDKKLENGFHFTGILCIGQQNKRLYYIPYEECCWVNPPVGVSKIDVLKKIFKPNQLFSAWFSEQAGQVALSLINVKEARSEFRKLSQNKKISITKIAALGDVENEEKYGYYLARSNNSQIALLVEADKNIPWENSLGEVIQVSHAPQKSVKVAVGEVRYLLDIPPLYPDPSQYRSQIYRKHWEEKLTIKDLLTAVNDGEVEKDYVLVALYQAIFDDLSEDDLNSITQYVIGEMESLQNSRNVSVAPAILLLLGSRKLIGYAGISDSEKASLITNTIQLVRNLGFRALRSLHVEVLVDDWLGDTYKRENMEGLWNRLNQFEESITQVESYNMTISSQKLRELEKFCQVAIPLRAQRELDAFTPIGDALLVTSGNLPLNQLGVHTKSASELFIHLLHRLPVASNLSDKALYNYLDFTELETLLRKFIETKADFYLLENLFNH